MGANTYWSDFYHRVIILEFTEGWTYEEYSNLVKESVNMLNSVRHKVAIVIDFSQSRSGSRTYEAYEIWLDAIHQWRKTSTYADFWININPNPWERIVLWTIGLVYNPTNIIITESQDKACHIAIEMLDKMAR